MLESIWEKICQKKGLTGHKMPFWGIKNEKTAHFSVNSYSLWKYLSFDMLESMYWKKKQLLVKEEGLLGRKSPFWGVKFLFSVKTPFIWNAGTYWGKKQLMVRKKTILAKKGPFLGVEKQKTAHFSVNSYSL